MKGRNPLVIVLVAFLFVGVGAVFFLGSESDIETTGVGVDSVQKPVPFVVENVDGDRLPQEFQRLVIDLGDMQHTLDSLNNKIEVLEVENEKLKQVAQKSDVRDEGLGKPDETIFPLPSALSTALNKPVDTSEPFGGEIGKFIAPLGVVSDAAKDAAGGLKNSIQPLSQSQSTSHLSTVQSPQASGMVWLQPMDSGFVADKKSLSSNSKNNRPSMLADLGQNPLNSSLSLLDESGSKAMNKVDLEGDVDPRFTIANGSVITNALTVTAMVGRIPVDGNVTDPWRFKISTGANIVMPNGHELQGLEKTILQGNAIGDLNLRCVSARIDTMTFIFSDGRIVTHKAKGQGGNTQNARPDQFLGYISDQWANPCMPGELITNAPQAISQMGFLGVAASMADGIAESETQSTVTDRGSVIKNVVGDDQLTYAGYKGVATGVNDVRGWFSARMGQYFDVIYARAGQVVDIHITQEIKIDYDSTGRKVRYEKTDADNFGYMD